MPWIPFRAKLGYFGLNNLKKSAKHQAQMTKVRYFWLDKRKGKLLEQSWWAGYVGHAHDTWLSIVVPRIFFKAKLGHFGLNSLKESAKLRAQMAQVR